jgi:ATP-dependent helicase/DNAse subunit B
MPNKIFLAPLLSDKRQQLIEQCAEYVGNNQSDRFLYLAASSPLLDLVTQQILDGTRNRGVWGELPVYLFRGFVRRILATAQDSEAVRLPPRVPIDREELPLKRSLVAQILDRLSSAGELNALAPLARREGCVNTVATLIGEIQRAARTPEEVAAIVAARAQDYGVELELSAQLDFDREVSLIYNTYSSLLNAKQFTEDDADQLRALTVLRGDIDGGFKQLPWLDNVELLIIDGFFDFTPVQGEILRQLIPRIPETLVNLNFDSRNPTIFSPFQQTIEQLESMARFEVVETKRLETGENELDQLRERLFNPEIVEPVAENGAGETPALRQKSVHFQRRASLKGIDIEAVDETIAENADAVVEPVAENTEAVIEPSPRIKHFECGDRATEIHAIAREIKQLIGKENYALSDIALIVRERALYAPTIARVMQEQAVPCNLEVRVDAVDVQATRAAIKLLLMLEQLSSEEHPTPRISDIADLIKSEYFQLSDDELRTLSQQFDSEYLDLLLDEERSPLVTPDAASDTSSVGPRLSSAASVLRRKRRYRIGFWDADALENAFAYVGGELPVTGWLSRAQKLIQELPNAEATREILNIDAGAHDREADVADNLENAETAKLEEAGSERKRRPSRDIHPATLAWTSLVTHRFTELILAIPREGTPVQLRVELMRLLEQLGFREQAAGPARRANEDDDLPQVMLNFSSLESMRRAFVAAIKSIEVAGEETDSKTRLSNFIAEVRRALGSQTQILGAADRTGLRVLEATDVRGLHFRAVFIAGLIEGGFPLRVSRDWIYPHEERERLKKYGLTLEDISPATLLKEEHYFYQSACRATERLYLTRPLMLEDDSETVASYYIDEVKRAIAPVEVETLIVRRDYDGIELFDATNTSDVSIALVRQEERHRHAGRKHELQPEPRIKRLLTLARNDGFLSPTALRRIEIERERAGPYFGSYDGEISDPHLLELLRRRFGPDYVHSASGLGVFGNCPFRFFAQRVLKLEPRGEAALDLQAIDAGKLLHDILRRFFERHRRQALNTLNQRELRDELGQIADKVFDEHERVVPPLNKQIWKIDREIRKILLDQVLLYELGMQEETADKQVVPALFEVAFGGMRSAAKDPESTDQPLELTRGTLIGNETIKVSGQIDRVDVAADNTVIAYDYKLSVGASMSDITSGRNLQLPIYLEALEKLILPDQPIAGGGYYIIRGGSNRRNQGLYRATKLNYLKLRARNSVLNDEEWQSVRQEVLETIWKFLDGMRAGRFRVDPSERLKTCRFCDFSAVCRYDRDRIDHKKK